MDFSTRGSPTSPPAGRDDDRGALQRRSLFTLEGWAFAALVGVGALLFAANWLLWHH